jgi:hypothetical protein
MLADMPLDNLNGRQIHGRRRHLWLLPDRVSGDETI